MSASNDGVASTPDSSPAVRAAALPAGACDTHIHLFGPLETYPPAADAPYRVPDATPAQLRELQGTAGVERAVVVHAVASGRDNRRTLDALRDEPGRLRGVLTPPLAAPDEATLDEWHRLGVRGIRYSYTATAQSDMGLNPAFIARIAELGWHAQVHVHGEQIVDLAAELATLPGRIVIDHMARIPASAGIGSRAFASLLRLLDSGRVWVKLSAPMRMSGEAFPWADVAPMARALVAQASERMVWGSDWPHVNFDGEIPPYADLLHLLEAWVPDPACRRRILVDNACELYDFPPPGEG